MSSDACFPGIYVRHSVLCAVHFFIFAALQGDLFQLPHTNVLSQSEDSWLLIS